MVLYTTFVIIVLVTIQYTNGKMLPKSRLGFLCGKGDVGKHQTGQSSNQSSAEYEHEDEPNNCLWMAYITILTDKNPKWGGSLISD